MGVHDDILSPRRRFFPKHGKLRLERYGSGPSDVNRQRAVAIGRFLANGFGLHDMNGNVSERVEDCWHDDYPLMTPTDGSAWLDGDRAGRVVRGGSWEDSQVELRSAARTGGSKEDRFYRLKPGVAQCRDQPAGR
jgi:formylglycine-generating enzyme required for sulfatase activity